MRQWFAILLGLGAILSQERSASQVTPDARRVLAGMVRAYRSLRSMEIETQYTGETGGFSKPLRTRLLVSRPNRLLYEMWQSTPGIGKVTVRRYLCDGRTFYSYDEAMGYYTRSRAPRDLRGMDVAGVGIELAAFAGEDPFARLESQVRSARVIGVDEVEGDACDVVLLDSGNESRSAEARLYVSRTTHFLRRFAFESVRLKTAPPEPPPEPLNPDDPPEQELHEPPVNFHYDSAITPNPRTPPAAFTWTPPAGALLYEPIDQMLDPRRYKYRPSYEIVGRDGKKRKPLTYRELVEMAKKQGRRRR